MLVFRLERNGVGPYRQYQDYEGRAYSRLKAMILKDERKHTPIHIEMNRDFGINIKADAALYSNYVCAFTKRADLFKYFNDDMIKEAYHHRFTVKVYDVPTDAMGEHSFITRGGQVFFDSRFHFHVNLYDTFKDFQDNNPIIHTGFDELIRTGL